MQAVKDLWQGFAEVCPWALFVVLLIAAVPTAVAGYHGLAIGMLLVAEIGLLWPDH